jgi:prophage DNA circulation protein
MGLLSAVGDIVGIASNPYGTPSKGEWTLTEGSFFIPATGKKVKFFFETAKGESRTRRTGLEQISDTGGRRKVIYEYPYKDGQVLDDLGRKGEKFAFNLKFWGTDYKTLFQEFLDTVTKSKESGILTHPVLGQINCGFLDYEFVHRYDEFSAVTIRANFIEDTKDQLLATNLTAVSANSSLRSALSALTDLQASISDGISVLSATLLIPAAVKSALNARLASITGQLSRFLGQLSATFSTSQDLKRLAAAANQAGGYQFLSSGISQSTGAVTTAGQNLPPVFQVGFDENTASAVAAQETSYANAAAITPQQAVYQMNVIRSQISDAITEVDTAFGNSGADVALSYRTLAVVFQQAVEASVYTTGSSIKVYTVPRLMSLRQIAADNGLDPDRQNDIFALNPGLDSANFVPQGTQLTIPTS